MSETAKVQAQTQNQWGRDGAYDKARRLLGTSAPQILRSARQRDLAGCNGYGHRHDQIVEDRG